MLCPRVVMISRWMDEDLSEASSQSIRRHLKGCVPCRRKLDEIRNAAGWVSEIAHPGRGCLNVEEMAAVLEGSSPVSRHIPLCPWCSLELHTLRSLTTRPRIATRRRKRPGSGIWNLSGSKA